MINFIKTYNYQNLIGIPPCFKNPENIDLLFTNSPYSFQSSGVTKTGLSYFHKMTVAVVTVSFHKIKRKYLNYRKYNSFSNERYTEDLVSELSKEKLITNFECLCHYS